MQRVRISVNRLRRYEAGSSFEVFGDLGSGTVDLDHPLTPRAVSLWPDAAPRMGHLLDGHLSLRHLDSVAPDGHLEGGHLCDEHLWPAVAEIYDTPRYVFGRFLHSVRMVNSSGASSAETNSAVTVNAAPSVPRCMQRDSYDAGGDQMSFSYQASRFDAVGGK